MILLMTNLSKTRLIVSIKYWIEFDHFKKKLNEHSNCVSTKNREINSYLISMQNSILKTEKFESEDRRKWTDKRRPKKSAKKQNNKVSQTSEKETVQS